MLTNIFGIGKKILYLQQSRNKTAIPDTGKTVIRDCCLRCRKQIPVIILIGPDIINVL